MGKKGGGGAPQGPDPKKVIEAQGIENLNAGLATTAMNRYNTVTPYGTQTWKRTPHAPPGGGNVIPAHVNAEPSDYMSGVWDEGRHKWRWGGAVGADGKPKGYFPGNTPGHELESGGYRIENLGNGQQAFYSPTVSGGGGSDTLAGGGGSGSPGGYGTVNISGDTLSPLDEWTQTISLNDDEQKILDLSRDQKITAGGGVIDQVGNMVDDTFFKGGAGSFASDYAKDVTPGAIRTDIGFDEGGTRARVEDALYSKYAARLDPRFTEGRTNLESNLVNKGIARGNELWNLEQDRFGRTENDAYSQAANDAILMGGGEVDRIYGRAMGDATFANQAQGQKFGQDMGLANTRFANDVTRRNLNSQEMLSQYAALSQAMAGQPLNGAPSQVTPGNVGINATDAAGIYNADTLAKLKAYGIDQQTSGDIWGNLIGAAGKIGAAYMGVPS